MPQNFEKPVVGFNHNVKHRGKLFHIQTEDSGVKNPHVITHVFVGGNIVATKKISYADILDAENLPDAVRQLMEMQHKEILRNLINGVYDDDVDAGATAPQYQPGQIAPSSPPPPAASGPSRPASGLKPLVPKDPAAKPAPTPAKPKESPSPVATLFGDDLISEKSLDEVILSYLAGEKDQ